METGERPPTIEKLKSFDLMASVDMLRFDIQRFGEVLPETRRRVYDEELSLMAEGVDRASRTPFTLRREGDALVYFDDGEWRPYMDMLQTGYEVAQSEADADPRRQFLLEWASRDKQNGYFMHYLQPGDQMVWHNSYPFEVEQRYGTKFLRDCGLFPDRHLGFIYRASCNDDGSVQLESQTVDRSDADGFAAVEQLARDDPNVDMEMLVQAYDDTLTEKYSDHFYAGRTNAEKYENAWEEIVRHRDLVAYFLNELEAFAASDLPRAELEKQVKRHVIGSWKAFKTRLDRKLQPLLPEADAPADLIHPIGRIAFAQERLALEVQSSFEIALRNGEVKVGCGGSVSARSDEELNLLNGQATFAAIFGPRQSPETEESESGEEDDFGPLNFKCPRGHWNKRPRAKSPKDFLTHCKHCNSSLKC